MVRRSSVGVAVREKKKNRTRDEWAEKGLIRGCNNEEGGEGELMVRKTRGSGIIEGCGGGAGWGSRRSSD